MASSSPCGGTDARPGEAGAVDGGSFEVLLRVPPADDASLAITLLGGPLGRRGAACTSSGVLVVEAAAGGKRGAAARDRGDGASAKRLRPDAERRHRESVILDSLRELTGMADGSKAAVMAEAARQLLVARRRAGEAAAGCRLSSRGVPPGVPAMLVHLSRGQVVDANGAWRDLLGYTREDVAGGLAKSLLHRNDRSGMASSAQEAAFRALVNAGRVRRMRMDGCAFTCRDGSSLWCAISADIHVDGVPDEHHFVVYFVPARRPSCADEHAKGKKYLELIVDGGSTHTVVM